MNKISAVYQIINTITGDRYIGSSRNIKHRWECHKCPSAWKQHPNSPMYQDFQKYGVDKFRFQILAPVMEEYLKQVEQEFIEMLKPAYNDRRSKGWDVERHNEYQKEYQKEYMKSERRKESNRRYLHQLCLYNGETLTLDTLGQRFRKAGVEHPFAEARKYLIEEGK